MMQASTSRWRSNRARSTCSALVGAACWTNASASHHGRVARRDESALRRPVIKTVAAFAAIQDAVREPMQVVLAAPPAERERPHEATSMDSSRVQGCRARGQAIACTSRMRRVSAADAGGGRRRSCIVDRFARWYAQSASASSCRVEREY